MFGRMYRELALCHLDDSKSYLTKILKFSFENYKKSLFRCSKDRVARASKISTKNCKNTIIFKQKATPQKLPRGTIESMPDGHDSTSVTCGQFPFPVCRDVFFLISREKHSFCHLFHLARRQG